MSVCVMDLRARAPHAQMLHVRVKDTTTTTMANMAPTTDGNGDGGGWWWPVLDMNWHASAHAPLVQRVSERENERETRTY